MWVICDKISEGKNFTDTQANFIQFFLALFLTLWAGWPCFRLVVGLTVGLAIGGVKLIGGEVAVGFSG